MNNWAKAKQQKQLKLCTADEQFVGFHSRVKFESARWVKIQSARTNEHRIEHKLDVLGNRLQSQLQGCGTIQWLRYGEGHVHGLMHQGQILIDFDHDGLHRETRRILNGPQKGGVNLTLNRWYDSLGRLEGMRLQGLAEHNLNAISPALVGQMERRRYRYDNLSRLITIEIPDRVLDYGYDGAGRLREQAIYDPEQYLRATAGKAKPKQTQRWDIDPAGNRLPSKLTDEREQRQYWAEMAHRNWQAPQFNLLGESRPKQDKGPRKQWADNRIGYFEDHALRYDLIGNRTEQLSMKQDDKGQYDRQRYRYDGANQLTTVEVAHVVGRGQVVETTECRYVYDALGRRLKKIIQYPEGKEHLIYFGWDGGQLVHIETMLEDGSRKITHIIYEPGTHTPMVRLSTSDSGPRKNGPGLMELINLAVRPLEQRNSAELAGEQEILHKTLERQMQQAIGQESGEQTQAVMHALGIDMVAWQAELPKSLEGSKKSDQSVEIHYFHCDHLGTPIALTDREGDIAWIARFDPWGNLLEEYNPQNIDQPLRLPGQYHDRETDLYYNCHRYYDPKIGAYINQDPIGLAGGLNTYQYALSSPINTIDPKGLFFVMRNVRFLHHKF